MSAIAEFELSAGHTKEGPKEKDPKAEFLTWFKNAPLGVAWCDAQGRLLALNSAMERILGGSDDFRHMHLSDLIGSQNLAGAGGAIAELLSGQRESFQIETNASARLGPRVQWSVWRGRESNASSPILAAAQNATIARSDRGQSERLEALGRLTGGVAHDFNNLLTGVLLYCDLLLATLEPNDRARRYAEEVRKAGFEAGGLVRQLLSLAKPNSGGVQPLSLNDVVEGMRNFLTRLVGENIELTLHLDPSLGPVQMDPSQCQQILLNLVLNARDAMPCGGQITVESCDCKVEMLASASFSGKPCLRCAMLVISDNGSGMDAEMRARLFEPFFTTKSDRGTGLGLATVHHIVSSHGGLIHVESSPGSGTRVSVLLPVLSESQAAESVDADFHPARSGKLHSSNQEE